jgi:histidinol-phosphate aminotransferase
VGAGAAIAAAGPWRAAPVLSASRGKPSTTIDVGPPVGPIRLNRNGNAYGPSAKVIATMQEAARTVGSRHPEADSEALRNKIAAVHHVTPEQVVLGGGASEILRMAVDAFVRAPGGPGRPGGPGGSDELDKLDRLIVARPTFELIGDYARRAGAEVIEVPLTSDYSHDLNAMLMAAPGLIYICNPNNPTGSLTARRDLGRWLRKLPAGTCVLIDEAYHHYAGTSSDYASFIDFPVDDNRVIVARTFSKIYGLSGLRVGYAIAAPDTARRLADHAIQAGVNVVAARAAAGALDDAEHVRLTVTANDDDRQEFFNQLTARMVRAIDSKTNFVMVNTGQPAAGIVEHFKKNDVLISGPFPGFESYIRVSLGTPAEMREFWRVWDLMPAHHKM